MTSPPTSLVTQLRAHGQEHVLTGWDALDAATRAALVAQLGAIDFTELETLRAQAAQPPNAAPENLEPAPLTPASYTREEIAEGVEALRSGQVVALLVAGGQGTRLGVLQPKGMFPAGPVSGASLYQIHAEKVLAIGRRYGYPLRFLVMTSHATDAETRAFFAEHRNFGLADGQVIFFQQGTMPAVDAKSGRLLLEAPGKLMLSPNGHGGTLTALASSGLLSGMLEYGIQHVFYFQVDNPLVKVCDPGFIGRHIIAKSEVSSKVVEKTDPTEKVGMVVSVNGHCSIIEYTLLPKHLAEQREPNGQLSFRAGSPAIHIFSTKFLDRVTRSIASALPYRVALKAVAHYDPQTGAPVPKPAEPNAIKFERFIFDAAPCAERWLVVETLRAEEFAPIKNADGVDSPETSRALQIALYTKWLRHAGIDANGHAVEVSPMFALDADEFAEKILSLTARIAKILTKPTLFG